MSLFFLRTLSENKNKHLKKYYNHKKTSKILVISKKNKERKKKKKINFSTTKRKKSYYFFHGYIIDSVKKIFKSMFCPIEFETIENFSFSDENHRAALKKNKAILLGVISPNKGSKYSEISGFYKFLDLYAQTVTAYSFPSVHCRHSDIDIAIVRENTEGEYR